MQKEQFSEWGWGDKTFFAPGGEGALNPLTKIQRTLVPKKKKKKKKRRVSRYR